MLPLGDEGSERGGRTRVCREEEEVGVSPGGCRLRWRVPEHVAASAQARAADAASPKFVFLK